MSDKRARDIVVAGLLLWLLYRRQDTSVDVVVTDTEGNPIEDASGNPVSVVGGGDGGPIVISDPGPMIDPGGSFPVWGECSNLWGEGCIATKELLCAGDVDNCPHWCDEERCYYPGGALDAAGNLYPYSDGGFAFGG